MGKTSASGFAVVTLLEKADTVAERRHHLARVFHEDSISGYAFSRAD